MTITKIKIYPMKEERLKAYVAVTLSDAIVIKEIKIIHGNNGIFVAMPSRKKDNGLYYDVVHPINSEARAALEKPILEAYYAEIQNLKSSQQV
jgi:stage V sporulation protein G